MIPGVNDTSHQRKRGLWRGLVRHTGQGKHFGDFPPRPQVATLGMLDFRALSG